MLLYSKTSSSSVMGKRNLSYQITADQNPTKKATTWVPAQSTLANTLN